MTLTDGATAEVTHGRVELEADGTGVVLVGVDGARIEGEIAQQSMNAAAYAAGLASRQGARLVAVWVRPRIALADTFVETTETLLHEREDAETDVRGVVERIGERSGVSTTSLVVRDGDDPFDELTAVAEEVHADAIVVGASAHRLGSIAVRLVKDARWPVTVVP